MYKSEYGEEVFPYIVDYNKGVKMSDDVITVKPLGSIKGKKKPKEIHVVFTRELIKHHLYKYHNRDKFIKWMKNSVFYSIREEE